MRIRFLQPIMAWHLIIDRSQHSPRFLATYDTREEAETNRDNLIAAVPWHGDVLYVLGDERGTDGSHGRRPSAPSFPEQEATTT